MTLRTTAIMKTDIRSSTPTFRALPEAELGALLQEHRAFVTRLAEAHEGHIVKPEGDGFWVVFPSVTAAALAAMRMQEDLRLAQPGKGDDRLAMRIVLSVGDVLHQDGALIGDAVVLAARIEALTPPDEIYLSTAAWHAVNQGEVRTALVDTFTLKGFTEPIPVYRIEQTHRTHVIVDQYIVMADLRSFSAFAEAASITAVENVLDRLLGLVEQVCGEFDGTTRFNAGDAYCLTFPEPALVMAAVQRLAQEWGTFAHDEEWPCPINIAVHKGALHAYRSYLYSHDLNIVFWVEEAMKRGTPSGNAIFITGEVRRDLVSTPWAEQFQPVDSPPADPQLAEVEIYRLR